MNTTTSCDSEFEPDALSINAAWRCLQQTVAALPQYESILIENSLHRVLAEPVHSPINVPGFVNSAMDGVAFDYASAQATQFQLKIIGEILAGHPFQGEVPAGACVKIMTGAPLPAGTDTVVMIEQTEIRDHTLKLLPETIVKPGQHVRHPGEDVRTGQTVFAQGTRLNPASLGVLSSLGLRKIKVVRKPRVAFFSTGDELISARSGEILQPGQIYDSNRYTLAAMLRQCGIEPIDKGIIADEPAAIRRVIQDSMTEADMILSTGGVSVGAADFIKALVQELGQLHFNRLQMKPGRPLTFATLKTDQQSVVFFGLPGNPVSVMATFYLFAHYALQRLEGCAETPVSNELTRPLITLQATIDADLRKRPGRTDFQRGVYLTDQGQPMVSVKGLQASHRLTSMSHSNCFVMLPRDAGDVTAGSLVTVIPFSQFN